MSHARSKGTAGRWCWAFLALGTLVAVPRRAHPEEPAPSAQSHAALTVERDDEVFKYKGSGMKAPKLIEKDCLSNLGPLPSDPDEPMVRSVTLKIGVRTDGTPGSIEIMGSPLFPAATAAIREAVSRCRWKPGLDASGAKTAMYVILPVGL